jgi:hypothetical protein
MYIFNTANLEFSNLPMVLKNYISLKYSRYPNQQDIGCLKFKWRILMLAIKLYNTLYSQEKVDELIMSKACFMRLFWRDKKSDNLHYNTSCGKMGRQNDCPAVWWSNVYFDRLRITQWDSGSVTLTLDITKLLWK